MKGFIYMALVATATFFAGCQKHFDKTNNTDPTKNPNNPGNFDYNNTKTVAVSIRLLAPDNTPLPNTPVSFYANVALKANGDAADSAAIYVTRVSDADGYITENVTIPASLDTVLIDAKYTGLIRNVKAYITGNTLNAVIGGTDVISGNVLQNFDHPASAITTSGGFGAASSINYVFMGETDVEGRPKYLVTPGDVISNKLVTYINTSLPESKSLADTHPQYITDQATGNINVIKQSDVFVTFVSEGASYLNSIGYYTYPTGHPPTSEADIKTITIMMPNGSLYGQGGNMHPGDKISLGKFDAGTTIAFVLLDNAYSYRTGVNTGALKFYGDKRLNPEPFTLKKHNVLLYDDEHNVFVAGFEDILRTSADCDHDFNDVVFYVTTATGDGISKVGVQPIDKPYDTDGDGVTDVFDEYPTDPTRAYNTYYPSKYGFATIAFEDEWPKTDDYDLNDLIVRYRYKFVSNAHNQVVELFANYSVQAAGASFKNGFGIEFPFNAGFVQSVTGQKLIDNYISLAGNGVEAGQQKAVLIPFDNHEALIKNEGGAYFINTKSDMPKVTSDTAKVHMVFTTPINFASLGEAPFNPFLISNERRAYEVHLPNHTPTQKADTKLFGTDLDATNPSSNYYYKSADGKPWAINFPGRFVHPLETINIADAYLHYNDWVNSNGALFKDWYSNKSTGYRDNTKLYTK